MGKALKLVQKLTRQKIDFRFAGRADKADIDQRQETLSDSIPAFDYARSVQRRFDQNFGTEFLAGKVGISINTEGTLERVDFGGGDFGLKLTLPSGIGDRAISGDVVFIREDSSQKAGKKLAIVNVESSSELRLTDDPSFSGTESNIAVRVLYSTVPAV